MSHLLRWLAPITEAGWGLLDDEATARLRVALAARKLVDFSGPHGWSHSATDLGRIEGIASPATGLVSNRRRVLSLVEARAEFSLVRSELDAFERGAPDPELGPIQQASAQIALTENIAVFHGWSEAGITGISQAASHPPVKLEGNFDAYPTHAATAVQRLQQAGVRGPYGMALGPEGYTGVIETTEHGGYPVFDHLRSILGGPIVWAPGVDGAIVISLRGGDFLFESGQDISMGYDRHDAETVYLYLEESFTFYPATPEAAVCLTPTAAQRTA